MKMKELADFDVIVAVPQAAIDMGVGPTRMVQQLESMADDDHVVRGVSMTDLGEAMGLLSRSVRETMNNLERHGLVTVNRTFDSNGHRAVEWILNWPTLPSV